jgi:ABC-type multidrug transport system fused ATPase/permease subunit
MRLVEVFSQFWPNLRPLRGWLILGLVLLAVAPLIAVLEILLFQRLVDDVLVPADFDPLMYIAAASIGLNLVSAVVSGAEASDRHAIEPRRARSSRTSREWCVHGRPGSGDASR